MKVKPRPGIILAGIPSAGADVPAKLAREWLANGLVTLAEISTTMVGEAGPELIVPPKRKRGRPRKVKE